ncbi:hypothetical protein [Streptomyces halstedii]|uniref:hypothetical protein n=1 Tax=Streptomyces halstedii TaxID=1944 RepID=UPI00335E0DEA
MSMPTELRDIAAAVRDVTRPSSPIPAGEVRDAVAEVLAATVRTHRRFPETAESVEMCSCGDEWACADVTAVRTLALVISRMAGDEAARVNRGWRI